MRKAITSFMLHHSCDSFAYTSDNMLVPKFANFNDKVKEVCKTKGQQGPSISAQRFWRPWLQNTMSTKKPRPRSWIWPRLVFWRWYDLVGPQHAVCWANGGSVGRRWRSKEPKSSHGTNTTRPTSIFWRRFGAVERRICPCLHYRSANMESNGRIILDCLATLLFCNVLFCKSQPLISWHTADRTAHGVSS